MVDPGMAVAYGGFLYLRHLWESWKSHKFGIYGTWGVGKTTLSRQLSTSGELEEFDPEQLDTSTHHPFDPESGRYLAPPVSRKRIAVQNTNTLKQVRRTMVSTDLGGHPKYFPLWLEDMVERDVEVIIWLIDHRHIQKPGDTSQQETFAEFVRVLVNKDFQFDSKRMQKKGRLYQPKVVGLVANKADVWVDSNWEHHWGTTRMSEHPIFEPFIPHLAMLQRHMIPTLKRPMSALRNWQVEATVWDLLQAKA